MKLILKIAALILGLHSAASALAQTSHPKPSPSKNPKNTSDEWYLRGRLLADPHNRDAHEKLCDLLEKRGEYRASLNERRDWLENNSWDSSELISLIISAQIRLNDPESGISATRFFLVKSTPDDEMFGWANYQLGKQLLGRDRISEALPFLENATKARPDMEEFRAEYGVALIRAKQADEGVVALRKAVELNPSSANLHVQLGNALAAKGDAEDQETEYKAACSLIKNDPYLLKGYPNLSLADQLTKLARIQIKHGKLQEAAESLDSALQIDPKRVYAYLLRARLLELEGHAPEAAIQRKKAESIVTDESRGREKQPSKSLSAALLLFVMDDEDEIIRILAARVDLPVFDREILGLALWETGQKEKAINELIALKNSKLSDASDYFSLAQALKTVGLNEEAKENYRKAYEMDPENATYRYEYDSIRTVNVPSS